MNLQMTMTNANPMFDMMVRGLMVISDHTPLQAQPRDGLSNLIGFAGNQQKSWVEFNVKTPAALKQLRSSARQFTKSVVTAMDWVRTDRLLQKLPLEQLVLMADSDLEQVLDHPKDFTRLLNHLWAVNPSEAQFVLHRTFCIYRFAKPEYQKERQSALDGLVEFFKSNPDVTWDSLLDQHVDALYDSENEALALKGQTQLLDLIGGEETQISKAA